ncbi:hypothetical protein AB8Q18_04635 [Neisseriaceae bacterium CLB008]
MKLFLDILCRILIVSLVVVMDYHFIKNYLERYQKLVPWQVIVGFVPVAIIILLPWERLIKK